MLALVVEQDPVRRAALVAELERHGHEVQAVEDVRSGLAGAAGGRVPELIALGARIGPDQGLDVVGAIRSGPAGESPIVVVVGAPDEIELEAALERGAGDVWTIPADADAPDALPLRLALAEHYARLQTENLRLGGEFALLRSALDLTGTGFVLTDPRLDDNPIVYANRSFYELTGYEEADVLGRNCRFLQGDVADPAAVARMRRAIAAQEPVTVELHNRRADGTTFLNQVHISPVRDARGEVVRFVGVQVDVSAHREAQRQERRSSFLAAASPRLDASLDLRRTLDVLARLSVPELADVCLVDVLEGDRVRRVAAAAAEPRAERLVREQPPAYAIDPEGEEPLARALRTGRAVLVDALPENLVPGLRPHAAIIVPLRARGRTVGALVLGALDPERRFGDEELLLAEDLGRRAALALDNARLYEQQRAVADTLQASLLPEALPQVEGLALATRYRPAGDGMEIGGDFYDAFPVDGGALALTIGDVTGKGARAASQTALTRHTLRTAATYERSPAAVLAALNRALVEQRTARGKYCTVAMCRLVPEDGGFVVESASAGHPLPLVLRRDGTVEEIGVPGTLLGFIDPPRITDVRTRLEAGDTLVLYTDGLTDVPTDEGLAGTGPVREALARCAGMGPDEIAGQLEGLAVRIQGGRPRDDVAIAVARVEPARDRALTSSDR